MMRPKIEWCPNCGKVKRMTWKEGMPDFESFQKYHKEPKYAKCDCKEEEGGLKQSV